MPDQIVIGDDGSGGQTQNLIVSIKQLSPVEVVHVWQPDQGFRLAAIRNKSFANATGDYIIQIDGDLILHRHFIRDHLRWARTGCFVSASRSFLSPELSATLLASHNLSYPSFPFPQVSKVYYSLRLQPFAAASFYLNRRSSNYKYVQGANMAFWKKDIVAVNGYDESFEGWGKEDNDLAVRLQMAGNHLRILKNAAVAWHLHHPLPDTSNNSKNEKRLAESISNKVCYAANGLCKHLQAKQLDS